MELSDNVLIAIIGLISTIVAALITRSKTKKSAEARAIDSLSDITKIKESWQGLNADLQKAYENKRDELEVERDQSERLRKERNEWRESSEHLQAEVERLTTVNEQLWQQVRGDSEE